MPSILPTTLVLPTTSMGPGSGPDSRGDVEGHLSEHAGRSEAGWSSLHDEEVRERQGVKSRSPTSKTDFYIS